MNIRFGELIRVLGDKAICSDIAFVAADVRLIGTCFRPEFHLRDQPREQLSLALRRAIDVGIDAAWVRARIPPVFHFAPSPAAAEKSLLDVGFVAVPLAGDLAFPFSCTDNYGSSGLMFSEAGPERATKQLIAQAFWQLLCRDPEELADFEERVYHPGAGVWLTFGCAAGTIYCDESDE